MSESTFVAELAISLYEPGTDILLLPWLEDGVREGTGRAGGAGADSEKFARDMGEVLGWEGGCGSTTRTRRE